MVVARMERSAPPLCHYVHLREIDLLWGNYSQRFKESDVSKVINHLHGIASGRRLSGSATKFPL
jgi:hypothetical protein